MSDKITGEEWLVGICLLVGLFLPHSSTILLLANPIMCLLFCTRYRNERFIDLFRQVQIAFISAIVISLLFNFTEDITLKGLLSALNICVSLFAFPFFSGIRIRNVFLYISILYILLSQICYIFHIAPLMSFFETVYPTGEDGMYLEYIKSNIDFNSSIVRFRLGGLYHNPNQCAKYTCLILALILTECHQERKAYDIIFIGIAIISIMLTGSRTGFVTFLTLLAFWVFDNNQLSIKVKTFGILSLIIGVLLIVSDAKNFRGLEIGKGMNDSVGSKFLTLLHYINSEISVTKLLFGNFDSSTFNYSAQVLNKFDAEYGYLFYDFGIIGLFLYIIFWVTLYKQLPKHNRFTIALLLWIVSSTVLFAYRSTFVFLLAFSRFSGSEEDIEEIEETEDEETLTD